jgi:N-acetyl-gamma-glutamyl-phosphate reductase
MHKVAVGVLGASGYAGRELCLLIDRHPDMVLTFAAAHGQRGQTARIGGKEVTFVGTDEAPLDKVDLVFSALPHGASIEWVRKAREAGAKVVDLSTDLRPGNGGSLAGESSIPYGLTEINRASLKDANVVANPGCYATVILLSVLPLVESGLVTKESLVSVAAASGVTGAGFTPRPDLLFAEVSEDYRAYAVGNDHRHMKEITAVLGSKGCDNDLVFTPHLLPVARGILATVVATVNESPADALSVYRSAYDGEPFIQLATQTPSLHDIVRTNNVRISAAKAANTKSPALIITAAIDNLTKGAAGQAVQNANVMFGFDETAGLQ